MAKREFLQLAHTYNEKKHGVAGWLMSEKLDGMRCLWDGGCSRGARAADIPWANVEKHARFVHTQYASGLWSRYGQPIHAPDWFLDSLPPVMFDGELYAGIKGFQKVMRTVKDHVPGPGWRDIEYVVFDCPRPDQVFADGTINNTNFKKTFKGILGAGILGNILERPAAGIGFQSRYNWLKHRSGKVWRVLNQEQLPFKTSDAHDRVQEFLAEVIEKNGEGVILKSPSNIWLPERCHDMLKHKKIYDEDGVVIGYTWGRETDKGSKLLGLMGALKLRQDNGKILEISGFTDEERMMDWVNPDNQNESARNFGIKHPGEEVCPEIHNPIFPRGCYVTYHYREHSEDGVAKEARYWRKKND